MKVKITMYKDGKGYAVTVNSASTEAINLLVNYLFESRCEAKFEYPSKKGLKKER